MVLHDQMIMLHLILDCFDVRNTKIPSTVPPATYNVKAIGAIDDAAGIIRHYLNVCVYIDMSTHCVDTSIHCIDMQAHLDMSRYILTLYRYI